MRCYSPGVWAAGALATASPARVCRKVVLPEPGPPTTRILAGRRRGTGSPGRKWRCALLDSSESIQHSLQKRDIGWAAELGGPVDLHHALMGHVGNQDPDDADR